MKHSIFNQLISELCVELEIKKTDLSEHWILKLEKANKIYFILGNRFDLNLAASANIADDKVGTYEVLHAANLPAIPHALLSDEYFLSTNIISKDFKSSLKKIFSSTVYPIVLKPNCGSRGRGVTLCKNKKEAYNTALSLLQSNQTIAISPYFPALFEYRCFFLDGKILSIYKKKRQNDWRHNLTYGSTPEVISQNTDQYASLSNLAARAGQALNLRFATIDILESRTNEKRILEINQSVSTSIFASFSNENYELAKNIYRSALKSLFNLK